jgi:hypothetical protein
MAVAIYLPALTASFQFDDWQVVLGDPRVTSLAAWWQSMPGMRALTKLTYALNHEWNAGAAYFRAVNVLLHAINSALVFLLVRALARRLRSADADAATVVASVAALIFALHPVQTESVTYIAARPNLIATQFSLLALLLWLRGRQRDALIWWPLATACYVAALAGKETAAVLPLAMLLCLWAERTVERRDFVLPAVLGALLIGLLLVVWPLFPYDYLLRTSLETRGPLENLAAQAQGVNWLAGQLVFWTRLNADPMLPAPEGFSVALLLQAGVLTAALATGVLSLRRHPALGFGILWFFLWLAPTNSLLARLDLANDRQLYLALVGPAWCAGHLVAMLRRHAWIVAAVLAVALACATVLRNRVYVTEVRFWQDVVEKSPHNPRGWNNLGMAQAAACRLDAAADAFEEATRRDPGNPLPQVNLALLQRGELDGLEHCR